MFPRVFYRGAHHNSDPPHRYPRIIYVCSTNTVAYETCVDITAWGSYHESRFFDVVWNWLLNTHTHTRTHIHMSLFYILLSYNTHIIYMSAHMCVIIIILLLLYDARIYTIIAFAAQGMSLIFVRPKFMGSWFLALSARNTGARGVYR